MWKIDVLDGFSNLDYFQVTVRRSEFKQRVLAIKMYHLSWKNCGKLIDPIPNQGATNHGTKWCLSILCHFVYQNGFAP